MLTSSHNPTMRVQLEWIAPALIVLVGLSAYANSLEGPFIFDDYPAIVDNPNIRTLWPLTSALSGSPQAEPVAHRPVIALSLALNYALGGLEVFGYHVFNIAVHLLAGLVLFGIVRRTLSGERLGSRYGRKASGMALACSLLWIAHPLLTESVTYITQRTESVMGLCYLLTLYCAIRSAGPADPNRWQLASVACCAAGMGSKQVMVTAPIAVLVYDAVLLSGSFRQALRRRAGLYLGLSATWLVLGWLVATGPQLRNVGWFLKQLSPFDYIATQFGVIVHYLRLAVWPHPLIIAYDWPPARSLLRIAPAASLIGVLLAATLTAVRRRASLGALGAWFFLTIGPTSMWPMVTEIAAERRMYLPLAAVSILVVLGADRLIERLLARRASIHTRNGLTVGLVAVLVTLLVALTRQRNAVYHSEVGLWRDVVAKQSNNPRGWGNLGHALLREGSVDEAIAAFHAALGKPKSGWAVARPGRSRIHYNLGVALTQKGDLNEAIRQYREALALRPDWADARNNLGLALAEQGRLEEARAELSAALRLSPERPDLHTNLGTILEALGRLEQAILHYRKALQLKPDSVEAINNLGVALAKQGRLDEAVTQFRHALVLSPEDPGIAANLREALAGQQAPSRQTHSTHSR